VNATFFFTAEDGRDPIHFEKEGIVKKLLNKLAAALSWATSPEGRRDLGAIVAAAVAIYTALHRAGV
jgi:hypothetical protein